ncbi:PREDICTED: retrotransposon, partial [Prunus dulcis]
LGFKPITIRTVLSIAVSFGWPIRQLNVKNAFLRGPFLKRSICNNPFSLWILAGLFMSTNFTRLSTALNKHHTQ